MFVVVRVPEEHLIFILRHYALFSANLHVPLVHLLARIILQATLMSIPVHRESNLGLGIEFSVKMCEMVNLQSKCAIRLIFSQNVRDIEFSVKICDMLNFQSKRARY